MSSNLQHSRWTRTYLQTITLMHKNVLIFYKSWISTLLRALLFPIIVAIFFSELKYIGASNKWTGNIKHNNYGISNTSYPVRELADAMNFISKSRLVFVRNGISNDSLGPIIEGVFRQPGMEKLETYSVDDPNDLFDLCQQSLSGKSDCFAAIVFQAFNETSVDYIIALDSSITTTYDYGDYRTDDSLFGERLWPLQWAIESQIGNFSAAAKPSTVPFTGWFGPNVPSLINDSSLQATEITDSSFWLSLVATYIAANFILIPIGILYHLATFVAKERETGISELMAAQTVTASPRILANLLSFFTLYFPGLLASSIILTQVLFLRTSDILFLWMMLLAGASITACSHFVGSLFGKAQLSGLTASTLGYALALITMTSTLTVNNTNSQIIALGLLFPPCTFAYFISDVANAELNLKAFSLAVRPLLSNGNKIQKIPGYAYVIFFVIQIIAYTAATYAVEKKLWGVTRNFLKIPAESDVALRCTGLTKTYYGKRAWYWPFMRKGDTVVAINDLNLEVKKGSVTFLLGPNGGGKTTTLKCVAGMTKMDPTSVLQINEGGLVFGICPQMNVNWETLTVKEHIKIWRKLKTAAFRDLEPDDDDVIAECDLLEKVEASAKTLSGGQARKLQLAMAFVGGSKVCCIDEASSGLDPLSRRNIWNIIQKGHNRRTILITTHFLDEADVLSDHIAIVYKGNLVCEGPGTSLKASYGDAYLIRSDGDVDGDTMVWQTANSAEATKKLLELEALGEDDRTYNVVFPTLEQVFLKVTSDTAINRTEGDGVVGGEEDGPNIIDEKLFALEQDNRTELELESGQSIGMLRQIVALFRKRYILLLQMPGWLSYGINLIIPIVCAAAVAKFVHQLGPMQTCADNNQILRSPLPVVSYPAPDGFSTLIPLDYFTSPGGYYQYDSGLASAYVGPESAFSGAIQDEIYTGTLDNLFQQSTLFSLSNQSASVSPNTTWQAETALISRATVNSTDEMVFGITNSSGNSYFGFGLWSPSPETSTLYYNTYEGTWIVENSMEAFNLLTNRIANTTTMTGTARLTSTKLRAMRHAYNKSLAIDIPLAGLITLAFIAAASIAVIYPAYEKNNRVRALQYCNGVEPFALWLGYLLFDIQLIVIQAILVFLILFVGPTANAWYEPSYLLGTIILFGIATYLGTYLLSLFTKKAAFAIAAGIHELIAILYFVAYILVKYVSSSSMDQQNMYTIIQYTLGLLAPGPNLLRALLLAGNGFGILCGKYGTADTSRPFAYVRYGSIYTNLIVQILLLILALFAYEYGSLDWVRRNITQRRLPARLHYIIEASASETAPPPRAAEAEKQASPTARATTNTEILNVNSVSKIFGRDLAVQNISFGIQSNRTMALLGGNGAGKTTIINMIRGELTPSFGTIFLDGSNVSQNPRKARLGMGVCPQDDAVDNLTVEQTLSFYATVKGLRLVRENVEKVMRALNIEGYREKRVADLSGGTKRKLSVAIALLGNPRILLLDEPSTGQDAGAKRVLWDLLRELQRGRGVLLTTHSMEEAEALASDVCIIGGRMLAKGTLGELERRYGAGFTVKGVGELGVGMGELEEGVRRVFGGEVKDYVDRSGLVQWELPMARGRLGEYMRGCEELMGNRIGEEEGDGGEGAQGSAAAIQGRRKVLSGYTIAGPTLEEVFMNVAREAEAAGGA